MKGSFEVNSLEETWQIAKEFAKTLKSGDVVCLEGDLGAGKTTFTQGLAAALGVKGRVTSPTFCLVQEHFPLVHMDLYRLNDERDVLSIGWEDYRERGAIIVVEWPDRAKGLIPETAHRVVLRLLDEKSEKRRIDILS